MPRGRPRKDNSTRPPCYFESHGSWFIVKRNVWTPLPTVRSEADAHRHYAASLEKPIEEHALDAALNSAYEAVKTAPREKPWAPNTIISYNRAIARLKHLLRRFTKLEQIKQKDAAQVKVLLAPTPTFANHTISLSRQIFNYFLEQQMIEENPFLAVKRHQVSSRKRLILPDEWQKIYSKSVPRLQCMMDGMRLTDQRVMDVVTLDERNIHEDGPGIEFEQEKGGKKLIVEWNPELREWVARCRALRKTVVRVDFSDPERARPLFRGKHGRCPGYSTVYKQWRAACKLAGIEPTQMRDIRAYSATAAEEQGLNAQDLLGHTDPATSRIYLRGRKAKVVKGPQFKNSA